MIDLPVPPAWQHDALCAQMPSEVFFPKKEAGEQTTSLAKAICAKCTVAAECLAWALDIERDEGLMEGIYGGVSPRDRAKMLRETERACKGCGQLFVPADRWVRFYCSPECARRAHLGQRRVGGAA